MLFVCWPISDKFGVAVAIVDCEDYRGCFHLLPPGGEKLDYGLSGRWISFEIRTALDFMGQGKNPKFRVARDALAPCP